MIHLQIKESAQLKSATHIFHLRANPEIKFHLPQALWNIRINWSLYSILHILIQCLSIAFHNREMFTKMRLSRRETNAQTRGISSDNNGTYHSDSIHLRSRHTDWTKTLKCAILSHITVTKPSTKLDTRTCKIPLDIKLADQVLV